jgi:hypothetical protein
MHKNSKSYELSEYIIYESSAQNAARYRFKERREAAALLSVVLGKVSAHEFMQQIIKLRSIRIRRTHT